MPSSRRNAENASHTQTTPPRGRRETPLTFGMHLELSAQRTNFTCPRDFGGLLRPVARLFLVISGWLGRCGANASVFSDRDRRGEPPGPARYTSYLS